MVAAEVPPPMPGSVRRSVAPLAAVVLVLLLGAALLGPAKASAATTWTGYCSKLPANWWCGPSPKHDFFVFKDYENYIGSVHSCLRGRKPNGSNYVFVCGYTPLTSAFSPCGCGLQFAWQNLANGNRTLYGLAQY